MDEVEAEQAVSLPNKEVMSLLDVNANVDLGLNLAAPVDLAAAANLNVAAPIEASAAANLLSPDAQAVALAQQHGSIDQGMTGTTADATAQQHSEIAQNSNPELTQPAAGGTTADAGPAAGGDVAQGAAGATGAAVGAADGAAAPVDGATGPVPAAAGDTTGD